MKSEILDKLKELKIMPVLAFDNVEEALFTAELLTESGLLAAEVTFRTSKALDCIKAIADKYPNILLGAGTVLNIKDLKSAKSAGVKFAVAPGFNKKIVGKSQEIDLPFFPGVCTPSDVENALEAGVRIMKFFPAEATGGIKMLKSIIAPYTHLGISFIPTGGITENNINTYLCIPEVVACGGTWLIKKEFLKSKDKKSILATIKKALEKINKRGEK